METWMSTRPATPGSDNEDAVALAADGRAAVLVDGAGLPAELRSGCGHPVSWYADVVSQAMLRRCTDPGQGRTPPAADGRPPMAEALREAIADALSAHGAGCRPAEGSPSSTLAAWRIVTDADGVERVEWAVLADSSLFLRHRDGRVVEIIDTAVDDIAGTARSAARAQLLAEGWSPQEAHVEAYRRTTERLRNVAGGFWCCHVDPEAAWHAATGQVPVSELDGLVLASDGITRLVHRYGLLSAETFVARCLEGDHEQLYADLRRADLAHRDPAPAGTVKTYDDATLVAARW